MSSKDEILQLNQMVSEIDKRLFELRSKLNQLLKQIPKEEEALAALNIKIQFSRGTIKHMKSKPNDLVDILEFKQSKAALNDQLENLEELSASLVMAKKARAAIVNMITRFEAERDIKRRELNEYGQVETFVPKKAPKTSAKGSVDGKAS